MLISAIFLALESWTMYSAARCGTDLRLMLPMISGVDELRQARTLIEEVCATESFELAHPLRIGVMIEVPSAALIADVLSREADFFSGCRAAFYAAGEPLLQRAQAAGVARADTNFNEVIQMVSAIAKIATAEPDQTERILDMALDGLRYRPAST